MTTDAAPLMTAILAAVCVVAVVIGLLYKRIAGPSPAERRLKSVIAAGASFDQRGGSADDLRRRKLVDATLRELEQKQKSRRGTTPTLMIRMRQAGLGWSQRTYLLISIIAGAATFLFVISGTSMGSLSSLAFAIAGGLLLPHLYVAQKRKRRFDKFTEEFPNAVDIIVRGVKSGLPLVDCLKIIATEAQEPVRGEFRLIIEDQTLGIPLDEAVQRLAERVALTEANFFSIVIAIQSRTGGSLSEALGNLSRVLRERKKMKAKIRAMSSEAKASAGIIGSMPFAVTGFVYLSTPEYITLLFTTLTGNLVLAASGIWMLIGILVMRKMINFDF
jgi:tight adherence protein B